MSSPSSPPTCSIGTYVKLCLLVSQRKLKGMTKFKELTGDYSLLLVVAVVAQSLCHVLTLQPHGLQHASVLHWLSPGVCSNSCLLTWWCHLAISSSVVPFCCCPQSFPASGSFQMSQLFLSGSQTIGVSALASVLLMSIQGWCSYELAVPLLGIYPEKNHTSKRHMCPNVHSSAT